jgi:phenylalanyl-tRNA synthetase beta chain
MRVPLSWLGEWVNLKGLTPEQLAEGLTCAGLEVETIDAQGPAFKGVIVAEVAAIAPHPQADKLRLVTVNNGTLTPQQLVCGAPNVAVGMRVALAQEGATVFSPKQSQWFTLGSAVIRGVPSAGMLCSLEELALQDQFDKSEPGIWDVTALTSPEVVGQSLDVALGLTTDTVLTLLPTANRGDAMAMAGIAQEVAAIFQREQYPQTSPADSLLSATASGPYQLGLTVPEVCTAYMGVWLTGVTVAPSPPWLVQRLMAVGLRSINNVVDVTNLMMWAWGQPLHAFDHAITQGGLVDVVLAQEGQTLTTLDGLERKLTSRVPVVTVNQTPVAVAGIMGGLASSVTEATTSLFLEVACFAGSAIRKGSQALGLRTEASARFERGVDPAQIPLVATQAVALLKTLTGGSVQQVVHSANAAVPLPKLTLRLNRLHGLYGIALPDDRIRQILCDLGFGVETVTPEQWTVTVPSARLHDVNREIDVIEEVIRIAGLQAVPERLPQLTVNNPGATPHPTPLARVRQQWVACGYQEVMTSSLVGLPSLSKVGLGLTDDMVAVQNGHSPEHSHLRTVLWPSVLLVALNNLHKGHSHLQLFECGRVYHVNAKAKANPRFTTVKEQERWVALLTGDPVNWLTQPTEGFYRLKGALSAVLQGVGCKPAFAPPTGDEVKHLPDTWHPGRVAVVTVAGKAIGYVGELHPQWQQALKLTQRVWLADVDATLLHGLLENHTLQVNRVSSFPAMTRDLALMVGAEVTHQQVVDAIQATVSPALPDVLQSVTVFDQFVSERFEPGQRSMAYRLVFQSAERTLTDDEVTPRMAQVVEALQKMPGVQCRA